MKNGLRLLLLLGLLGSLFLAGCSVRVYGVPKEEWQRMTPAERQQAQAAHDERQRLYQERRLYEAKQRAHEAELRAQQAREEAAHRPAPQQHVHAPAQIHFTLEGGTVFVAGRHRPFLPVTVELRHGESKRLMLVTTDERKPHRVPIVCSYEEGKLWLSNGNSRVHAQQIAYDARWHNGQRYQNLEVGGAVGLRAGILWLGSGAMPVVPSARSTAPGRGEMPHGREQSGTPCHDDHGRVIKPGPGGNCRPQDKAVQHGKPTSASSEGNSQPSHANSANDRIKSYRLFDKTPATPAVTQGNNGNGGKAQPGKNGAPHQRESEPSRGENPPRQNGSSAQAMEKVNARQNRQNPTVSAVPQAPGEKSNGGKNQAGNNGAPHPRESSPSKEKKPQPQNVSSAEARGKGKEKQQAGGNDSKDCSQDSAGKKGERSECDDGADVSKGNANAKGNRE